MQSNVYVYSQDEYVRLLSGEWYSLCFACLTEICEDKEWTKEETDYLFELAREYDGRFYVVADRYEYANGPPRTIEVCQI